MAKVGRQLKSDRTPSETSIKGVKEGEGRKTYLVNLVLANKLDAIAFWERKTVKNALREAMEEYIKKYEKKNGPVKDIPE